MNTKYIIGTEDKQLFVECYSEGNTVFLCELGFNMMQFKSEQDAQEMLDYLLKYGKRWLTKNEQPIGIIPPLKVGAIEIIIHYDNL